MEEDLLFKKYPYLGYSPNLIECFSIIGYEENFLPQIVEEFKNTGKNLFSPSVLSSILSNKDFGIIDNDLIINQIFPDYPQIIKISNNNTKNSISQEVPKTKNIIYSFIIDSPDGTKKLFYTCFGFIFYERYKHHDINNNLFNLEEYYIPKAFCIISQYSYFSFSYYICNNIYNYFLKQNAKMPIEIIIYNLVNFIPSPLNYNFNYNIFNYELDIQPYNVPQLSGYPYLDFDLTELFNILPLNLIIEIFLLTVVEQSILFFSSNLEILNMVMFIMYSLNYPCNNSTYFWHIVSISKNDLNEENRFISQIMTSLLGVNVSYDESINTFPFGDYHFIVDIDKKKIIFKESSNVNMNLKKEIEKLSNLKTYFQNIIKDKNVNSVFLKQFIENLKKDLENIISKEEQINQKNKKDICFFKNPFDKEKNKLIQECFYKFNINLLMIFYQNTNLIIGLNKIKLEQKNDMIIINKNEDSLNEEEKYFCELFKSSSKYKIYFENFIDNSDSHELLKIPLILSEEFINLKMKSNQNKKLSKISFFKIIDNLYTYPGNGTLNISMNSFYFQFARDKLKIYFKDYNDKSSDNNDLKFFTFNKNILNKYVFLLNNHYEKKELNDLFPSIKIKKESFRLIDTKTIVQTIQSELDKNNLIKPSNYLLYASVYVFSIFIPLYSYRNLLYYLDKFFICFKQIDFFLRFYIYIIIQAFYKYYLINNNTKKYPDMKFNNIKIIIYLFMNHLKEEHILPSEEMLKIQNIFFSKNISIKERGTFKEKNINKIELFERDNDNELDLKNKNIFQIFMKYNFGFKGFYKPKQIISSIMKESGNSNMIFKDDDRNNKKRKTQIVVIKIYDEIYKSELYPPKKIFALAQLIYKDYVKNPGLNIENINIKILREILINLIQYSIELDELKIPYEFFINGLYLTRDLNRFNRSDSRNI